MERAIRAGIGCFNIWMMNAMSRRISSKISREREDVVKAECNSDLKILVPREEIDFRSNFALEERSRVLIHRNDIESAIPLLEEASETQSQQLMLAECYIEIGRYRDAMTCAKNLKFMITSQPRPLVSDITELTTTSFDIRDLMLLRCASKLYKLDSDPNEAVVAIEDCSYQCYCLLDTLYERDKNMRIFVTQFGPKFILDILRDLRRVKHANGDRKKECEARCNNNVGSFYRTVKNYSKAIAHFKKGVRNLKLQKCPRSSTFKVLGDLLKNLGLVQYQQEKIEIAKLTYLQSLDAYGIAEKMESRTNDELYRKTQSL